MSEIVHLPIRLFKLSKGDYKETGNKVTIDLIQSNDYSTTIRIITQPRDELLISANIADVLNIQFKSNELLVLFDLSYSRRTFSFSLVFLNIQHLRVFINEYIRCTFEYHEKRSATTADKPDLDRYVSYICLDYPDKPKIKDEITFKDDEYECVGSPDNGHNFLLRSGKSTDNAMVLRRYDRHCDLGLFSLDRNCSFRMALPDIIDDRRRPILADDMISIKNDKSLMLFDESRSNEIYEMNLDRGVVITHYDSVDQNGTQQKLKKLLPTTSSTLSNRDESTFLAFTDRNTVMFDTRASKTIVNKSEYKSKNNFTCGQTSRSGYVAMGSADGIVRLYNGPCKSRATVNFQMNVGGDPVIGLDISEDEQWVLATCAYYLSVFNVYAQSTGKLAFNSPMGKDKPPLTRLALNPEHVQKIAAIYGGEMPPFSKAKFEQKGNRIASIVASIGTGLVSWDFRKIENGYLPSYSISLVGAETIIENEPFVSTNDIMFITDNQVSVIERKTKK